MPSDKDRKKDRRSRSPKGRSRSPRKASPKKASLSPAVKRRESISLDSRRDGSPKPTSSRNSDASLPITSPDVSSEFTGEDPRTGWRPPQDIEVPLSLEKKLEMMIERALAGRTPHTDPALHVEESYGALVTQPGTLATGSKELVADTAGLPVPTVSTTQWQSRNLQSPPPVRHRLNKTDCTQIRGVTALGSRPSDGRHFSPLDLPSQRTRIDEYDDSIDEVEEEINPFSAMPGLEDCPLAGLRSALSRPDSTNSTIDRQIALWRQARGGSSVRPIKTFRIEGTYAKQDDASAAFLAPELPPEMPLTHQQWGTDVGMRKQQRSYGIEAC